MSPRAARADEASALHLCLVVVLLCCLDAAALDPARRLTQYRHDLWTVENGLPQESVNAIAQTSDGYLWLATNSGLARFDGVHFRTFDKRNTPELKSNLISALCARRDGSLWIGTDGGGVTSFRDGVFASHTGLYNGTIFSLHETQDGAIWIGMQAGALSRIDPQGRTTTFSPREGMPAHGVSSIEDGEGETWIGTYDGGLVRLAGTAIRTYTVADGLPHDSVRALHRDRAGRLWIGTSSGLARFDNGRFIVCAMEEGAAIPLVRAIHEDAQGTLWLGTDHGLARVSGDRVSYFFTSRNGLSSDVVTAMLEDREGSLWIGSQGGLNRLRDTKFMSWTTREGLPSDNVRTVFVDADGTVWLGTLEGLCRLQSGTLTAYTTKDGLSTNIVSAILRDRAGTLWIGTRGGGLNAMRDGRFTHLTARDGLASDAVRVLYEDRAGNLWIGTDGGGVSRYAAGRFTNFAINEGLSSNFIRAIRETSNGDLWIGTGGGGVDRLRDGHITAYTKRNGMPGNTVMSILEQPDGSLLFGTYDAGLARMRNERIAACSARDGLYDDSVFDIESDAQGQLWMSSDRGVFRVDAAQLNAFFDGTAKHVTPIGYDTRDGLASSKCSGGSQPSGWKGPDGRIWFTMIRGASSIDPARIEINRRAPPVIIEDVIADGRALANRRRGYAGPGNKRIEIRYTATSLLNPERVRFKYRLEGFDPDWVDAGTSRVASYTNLPLGDFRFRVIASNDDGVWNTSGATYDFEIVPYFRQTAAFFVLCALLIAILIAAGVWLRLRQMRMRERQLVALVDERTRELRLANDHLRQANELKLELLGIAAHDLRNPLQAISGFAEIIRARSEEGSQNAKQAAVICRASDEMLRLINDLLGSVQIESGRLELNRTTVDMSALAAELAAVHRHAAERKEQQLSEELPAAPCLVEADAERLSEAMENLVTNAIKYTPRKKSIRISVRVEGSEARFEVRDEGPGLTAEDMKRLFGKFQRLSARTTGGESSSGLGLSIARQLVELQGGRIWAESEPGNGSVFTIAMPAAPRER